MRWVYDLSMIVDRVNGPPWVLQSNTSSIVRQLREIKSVTSTDGFWISISGCNKEKRNTMGWSRRLSNATLSTSPANSCGGASGQGRLAVNISEAILRQTRYPVTCLWYVRTESSILRKLQRYSHQLYNCHCTRAMKLMYRMQRNQSRIMILQPLSANQSTASVTCQY